MPAEITVTPSFEIDTYLGHLRAATRFENNQLNKLEPGHPLFPFREYFLDRYTAAEIVRSRRLRFAVVMSMGRWFDPEKEEFEALEHAKSPHNPASLFGELNEGVLRWQTPLPKSFLPFAMIAGNQPDKLVPSLTRASDRFQGVKISACTTLGPDDPQYDGVYHAAETHEWPVLIHCSASPGSAMNFGAVVNAARRHPQVNFIASHLGGDKPEILDKNVIPVLRPSAGPPRNLWLNTAIRHIKMVRALVDAVGSDRVVFASDQPFTDGASSRTWLQNNLSAEDFRKIMIDNPARALGLPPSGPRK